MKFLLLQLTNQTLQTMGKIRLIIQREFLTRVKKKSFIILTILGPILMAGFLAAAFYLGLKDEADVKVLVVDETFITDVEDFQDDDKFSFLWYVDNNRSLETAKEKFQKSDVNYLLYIPQNITTGQAAQLYFKKTPSSRTESHLNKITNRFVESLKLEQLKISAEDYAKLKTDINLHLVDIDKTQDKSNIREKAAVGYVFAILIYIFIFMYAVQVMRGVIEEKQNRIVEVIISSVRPFQLMMGKIIGVALVGLTQFVIWIIFSGILFTVVSSLFVTDIANPDVQAQLAKGSMQLTPTDIQNNDMLKFIFDINWPLMIGLFIFYFLGGYLLYSSMMAAIGAAVDNDTDTQQFMLPVTLPLVFGFIIAQMTIENPDSAAAVWFSQIPFTSPVVMLVRVAMGVGSSVSVLELITSMLLLIAAFILTTLLAAKIYRIGILMYGKKVTYKELFKWLMYKN
jgi:ABC-2 type transport system permease protein